MSHSDKLAEFDALIFDEIRAEVRLVSQDMTIFADDGEGSKLQPYLDAKPPVERTVGLVVRCIVAIDATRVRFPVSASLFDNHNFNFI